MNKPFVGKKNRKHHKPPAPPKKLGAKIEKAAQISKERVDQWLQQAKASPSQGSAIVLDEWQKRAVAALIEGANVIVDAPTTAGKTKVVETYFAEHLTDKNFRACYTCPVKSLSNDKLKEFRELYGKGYVGIATGDFKENLDAPLVVATLETYRNSLVGVEPDLGRKLVVFDEYHYIQDEGRGTAWEEAIILTPPSSQLLLLSASIENTNEFAQWMERVFDRPTVLIEVEKRPVPLVDLIQVEDQWILAEEWQKFAKPMKHIQKHEVQASEAARLIASLENLNLTPTLIYAGRRLACNQIFKDIKRCINPLPPAKQQQIATILDECHEKWHSLDFIEKSLKRLMIQYGLAYHHSGLAPAARLAIETLLKDGHLRFCVGTMGLSLGINFSVRSTVITDFKRPGEAGMTYYSPTEVLQMTGRAGRRGLDQVGFSCWLSEGYFKQLGRARRGRCYSKLKTDPCTFLNLLCKGFSLAQIEAFYKKSFLKFHSPEINMNLVSPKRLSKKLKVELPCTSPTAEYVDFLHHKKSLCDSCQLRKPCHASQRGSGDGYLAQLHRHLHKIHGIDHNGNVTLYGRMARYFPQFGGLLFAHWIDQEIITPDNLLETSELIGALSLARFKEPRIPQEYEFPFDSENCQSKLKSFYPQDLFPEVYDTSRTGMLLSTIRDFNPLAGWIVREWIEGRDWQDLIDTVTTPYFGLGDVTALIYRVSSFLQCLVQAQIPYFAEPAADLRRQLLRDPVTVIM